MKRNNLYGFSLILNSHLMYRINKFGETRVVKN